MMSPFISWLSWLAFVHLVGVLAFEPRVGATHQIPPNTSDVPRLTPSTVKSGFSKVTRVPTADLLGRQLLEGDEVFSTGSDTCGWLETSSISYTCVSSGATCTSKDGYLGCCRSGQNCYMKTACLDYSAFQDGDCDLRTDFSTLCCTNRLEGECFALYQGSDDARGIVGMYDCRSKGGSDVLLSYDPREGPVSPKLSASTATSTSKSTPPSVPAPNPSGSNPSEGKDQELNVGAVAGGAVGGIVALAVLGFALFVYLRRRKQDKRASRDSSGPPGVGDGLMDNKPELDASEGAFLTRTTGTAEKKSELDAFTDAIYKVSGSGTVHEMAGSEPVHEMRGSDFRGWELPTRADGDTRIPTPSQGMDVIGEDGNQPERPKIQRKPLSS